MASWLRSAEELLNTVDKTARAVHSVTKPKDTDSSNVTGPDQAQSGSADNSRPSSGAGVQPPRPVQAQDKPVRKPSTVAAKNIPQTTKAAVPKPTAVPAAKKPAQQPAAVKPTNVVVVPNKQPKELADVPATTTTSQKTDKLAPSKNEPATKATTATTPKVVLSTPSIPTEAPLASNSDITTAAGNDDTLVLDGDASATEKGNNQDENTSHLPSADSSSSLKNEGNATTTSTAKEDPQETLLAAGSNIGSSDSLTTAPSKGADREERLSRALEGLRKKVQRLEEENAQLEDMLSHADAQARGGSGAISRLEGALAKEQAARITAEAALNSASAAKESELNVLKEELAVAKNELKGANEKLAELEAAHDALVEERKVSEGALLAAVRREMEAVEAQLQEERTAHGATRRASAAREQQLDASLADAGQALAATQRTLDERIAKLAAVEERCAALESEHDGLQLRLTQAETKAAELAASANGQRSAADDTETKKLIDQLETALAASKSRVSELESAAGQAVAEATGLREEVVQLRQQVSQLKATDVDELRRRLREVSDALYQKQTQLERVNADQAATRFALERQLNAAKAEAQQVRRRATATDRALVAAEDGVVPTDAVLGDAYARLANAGRVGGALMAGVKLLDDSASQSMRVLRRYPLARLIVLVYVLFIHVFCYALLHKLQHISFHAMELEMAAAATAQGHQV